MKTRDKIIKKKHEEIPMEETRLLPEENGESKKVESVLLMVIWIMSPQEFDVLTVIDFENSFARPETPYKYLRRLFPLSVNQDMIIPKWLFELPIIKPERNEF